MTVTICKECRYFAGEIEDPNTKVVFTQCAVLPMPINRPTDVPCVVQGFGDGMGDYAEKLVDLLIDRVTAMIPSIIMREEETH